MSIIYDIIILIWMHFIADFILQTDKMATNKSTSNQYLALHCIVYSIPFFWFGWMFAIVNGVAHFLTDWITSRVTTALHKKGERKWFFVAIGFDQAIHMTTLIITLFILGETYGIDGLMW